MLRGQGFPCPDGSPSKSKNNDPSGTLGSPTVKGKKEMTISLRGQSFPWPPKGTKERIIQDPRALQGSSGDSIPPPDTSNRARGGQSPSGLARMHGVRRGRKGETVSPTGPVTANPHRVPRPSRQRTAWSNRARPMLSAVPTGKSTRYTQRQIYRTEGV